MHCPICRKRVANREAQLTHCANRGQVLPVTARALPLSREPRRHVFIEGAGRGPRAALAVQKKPLPLSSEPRRPVLVGAASQGPGTALAVPKRPLCPLCEHNRRIGASSLFHWGYCVEGNMGVHAEAVQGPQNGSQTSLAALSPILGPGGLAVQSREAVLRARAQKALFRLLFWPLHEVVERWFG